MHTLADRQTNIQEVGSMFKKLFDLGVPEPAAIAIAQGFARWDALSIPLNPLQVALVAEYFNAVKAANLWRGVVALENCESDLSVFMGV